MKKEAYAEVQAKRGKLRREEETSSGVISQFHTDSLIRNPSTPSGVLGTKNATRKAQDPHHNLSLEETGIEGILRTKKFI